MSRGRTLAAAAVGAVAFGALSGLLRGAARAEDPPAGEFAPIYRVLESPRCQNCHPSDGTSCRGGPPPGSCATCHRTKNAPFVHGPPGVPEWRMPPADQPMPFEQKSAHDLCEQLKDPKRNGGKSLADLHTHFEKDPIVLWAWDPGPGRVVPPISHQELVKDVDAWIAKGAPCPP